MIRIRYRDPNELSPGLHAEAERGCRGTTVYLLSGLTAQQRRSALRRLRLSARMGHCPRLPAGQLALALLADWIRTALGRAGAVFRLHPAGSTLPIMVLSGGAIAFLLFSTVSIRVLHGRPADAQSSAAGISPVASAGAIPISGTSQGQAGLGGPGQGADSRQLTQPGSGLGSSVATPPSLAGARGGRPGDNQGGASQGGASQGGAGQDGAGQGEGSGTGGSGTTGGGTTLSGGANPSTVPAPDGGPGGSSATTPAATPSSSAPVPQPAPSATSSSNGLCVDIGPLGVCLHI